MKNKRLSIVRLAAAVLIAFIVGAIGMAAFDTPLAFFVGGGISLGLSLLPGTASQMGAAFMAIQTEVWVDRVEGNLFKDNDFLLKSIDDSKYVNNRTVHIPNAGAPPGVQKNRVINGTPTNPQTREDTDLEYTIGEFTTDPIIITDAEEKELSYNEMDSELSEMQSVLNERVAEDILLSWAATGTATLVDGVTVNANVLRTSGVDRNNLKADRIRVDAHLPGTAGSRLAFCMYDVKTVQKMLNSQRVPKKGRYGLLDSDMYSQLINDMTETQYTSFASTMNAEEGILGRLYGFTFYERSTVLAYNNAATPVVKPYGEANVSTDNAAALFWYEGYVSRAVGETRVFDQEDSPSHYGDVFSSLVRAGGSKRRKTEVGVVAVVQGAAA